MGRDTETETKRSYIQEGCCLGMQSLVRVSKHWEISEIHGTESITSALNSSQMFARFSTSRASADETFLNGACEILPVVLPAVLVIVASSATAGYGFSVPQRAVSVRSFHAPGAGTYRYPHR